MWKFLEKGHLYQYREIFILKDKSGDTLHFFWQRSTASDLEVLTLVPAGSQLAAVRPGVC